MYARSRAEKLRAMLRRCVVLIVLALLAVAAPASVASAKGRPAPKRCPKGQVRLTPPSPCVKVKAKPGATVKLTTAGARARFEKLAGKKGVRVAAALVKALQAKDTTKHARIAQADEDPDLTDGEWHPRTVRGHPGRYKTTLDQVEAGNQLTSIVDSTSELTEKVGDGVSVTSSVRVRAGWRTMGCPDANGVVKAHNEYTQVIRRSAERGGQTAFTETRTAQSAELVVQVDDDADFGRITYDGTGELEIRATGAASARYIMHWTAAAQSPDVKDADRVSPYARAKADPQAALAGTYRGPHGSRFSAEEEKLLIEGRLAAQDSVEDLVMRDVLSKMRTLWQENGRCVKVVLDPHAMALAGGQTGTFTATATVVADGTPAAGKVEEIAVSGEADQPHTTMPASGRLAVRFTMGQDDKGTLLVQVKSKRGMGSDIVDISRPRGWDLTYEGDGTYAQRLQHGGDTDTTNMTFHFKAEYPGIFFDGGAYSPIGHGRVTGTLTTKGTLGTGSYSCTGTPSWVQATLLPGPVADGATPLTLIPFTQVGAAPDATTCDREGYGGDYGGVASLTSYEPYAAHIVVTRDMLTQPEFDVPVTLGSGFAPNCGVEAPDTCSDSGTMTGTVHFKRRDGSS